MHASSHQATTRDHGEARRRSPLLVCCFYPLAETSDDGSMATASGAPTGGAAFADSVAAAVPAGWRSRATTLRARALGRRRRRLRPPSAVRGEGGGGGGGARPTDRCAA